MMNFVIADDGLCKSLDRESLRGIIEKIDLKQRTPRKDVAEQLRAKYSAYKSAAYTRTYASAYAEGIKYAAQMFGVDTSDWD